jgi:hypothetical protein
MRRTEATASIVSDMVRLRFVPREYRRGIVRVLRSLRDRLPPFAIERRLGALERHLDARLRHLEAQVDELIRRVGSKAA